MTDEELIQNMKGLNSDHEPFGWPAVKMQDINSLIIIIDRLKIRQHDMCRYVELEGRGKCVSNEAARALADDLRNRSIA